MVQILPEVPSFGSELGKQLGAGIGSGVQKGTDYLQKLAFEKEREKFKRGLQLQRGLATLPEKYRGKALQKGEPGVSEREISETFPGGRKIQEEEFEEKAILNPRQLEEKAAQRAQQKLAMGLPTTLQDEMGILRQENADIAQYKSVQREYGNIATDKLLKVMPDATDEQQAIFRKKFENMAAQGISEAQIEKSAAREAARTKHEINAIKKSIKPARGFEYVQQKILGTGRDSEKVRAGLKRKLQPLLNEGLYDTSRRLMAEQGYGPEETESIISSLGEGAHKGIADLPSFKTSKVPFTDITKRFRSEALGDQELDFKERQILSNNMEQILKAEPSTNLILLRKAYEEKGVPWRSFLDTVEELIGEGKVDLNEDQSKTFDILEQPPLNNLEKFLHGIGLIGR